MLPDEDWSDPGRRHVGGGAVGGGLGGPGGGDALRRHRGARQGHDGGVEGAAGAAAHVCGRGQSRRICQDSRTFQINFLCQMFCCLRRPNTPCLHPRNIFFFITIADLDDGYLALFYIV